MNVPHNAESVLGGDHAVSRQGFAGTVPPAPTFDKEITMELEWRNHWTSPEWKPMKATNERDANDELLRGLPYTEDGTQIRRKDTGQVLNWTPPRNEMNFWPSAPERTDDEPVC